MSEPSAPDLTAVSATERADYEAGSQQRPGEDHATWAARARRLEEDLFARHRHPAAVEPAPAPAGEDDQR